VAQEIGRTVTWQVIENSKNSTAEHHFGEQPVIEFGLKLFNSVIVLSFHIFIFGILGI